MRNSILSVRRCQLYSKHSKLLWEDWMIFSLDAWLLPAIAAGSSSYLVCLLWERIKKNSAPSRLMAGFLAALSFLMGGISAYIRNTMFKPVLEINVIIMFLVGASTTFIWLLLRKYLPGFNRRKKEEI